MLEVDSIYTYYGSSPVLQGVSLNVAENSVVVVLGRNGVGKTTLVHSVIGFVRPVRGSLFFKGASVTSWPSYKRVRAGMALVPQGRRIFDSLSVRENLTVATMPKENGWDLERVLTLFPRLKERINYFGRNLSGGERQMLAIGRALISNPDMLLLDEPSEGLAPLLVQELAQVLEKLKNSGLSMLLVEQNYGLATRLADYIYIMMRGRIVYECSAGQIDDEELKTRCLGL